MSNALSIEEMGTPAVPLVNQGFVTDGRSNASLKGCPEIRIITYTFACECSVAEEIETGVNAIMDDIIAALTKPLTAEEESPPPKKVKELSRIVFKGSLEEVNQFFYRRGWTDGFPVIPPTEEAVAEMLMGTNLPVDHVVAKVEPRLGKATVERIAINAVMAGALPTYLPVLIAGVQALTDLESNFGGWIVSTGSWAPFWVINGPIRNELHVNSSSGALSPGDIANATIGRAMGLIIKNIGGARKGIEDMGVMGNPGKYTLVIAENEEASPWEPFHVKQGFEKGDSTVTVSSPNSFWQMMPYGTDDKGILRGVVYNTPPRSGGLFWLVLNPSHATTLANYGWTKEGIANFVSEYSRAPLYHFSQYYQGNLAGFPEVKGLLMSAEDSVPVFNNPDLIRVIVAGGPGNIMAMLSGAPIHRRITKKVELPANWDNLVKKYKDMMPMYVRY